MEEFASEKIMEKKGGFFQALSEPFCPPAMQFHNPKGAEKTRQQTQAHTRARRQELVNKAMPKSVSKPKNDGRYQLEHLHNNDQNYVEVQQRPILKVKSAAEQYKEDNKSPDVLLSQDAMKAILIELQQLRQLKEDFEKYNGEGTVFGSINKDTLSSIAIVIPKNEVVELFEKLVQPMDAKIFELSEEIELLTQIRDLLLPKLMAGEINVE